MNDITIMNKIAEIGSMLISRREYRELVECWNNNKYHDWYSENKHNIDCRDCNYCDMKLLCWWDECDGYTSQLFAIKMGWTDR